MNPNSNNLNFQSNNELQNQPLSTNGNVVNSATQPPQTNVNMLQQQPKIKKKLQWWIPLLLFLGGFIMFIGSSVAKLMISSQEELVLDSQISNYPIVMILRSLAAICWLLVIPALIIVIIKYNAKTPEEKNQENIEINNMIINATSLDEKLQIAYIGYNYQKIMLQKFSLPALFLSWLYTLYRKVYIPSIIGMAIISLLSFIPYRLYYVIVLIFVIVLGMNFNKWYVAYVKNQIQKIKINNPNADESNLINICRNQGGTNVGIAIAIYIAFAVIQAIIQFIL